MSWKDTIKGLWYGTRNWIDLHKFSIAGTILFILYITGGLCILLYLPWYYLSLDGSIVMYDRSSDKTISYEAIKTCICNSFGFSVVISVVIFAIYSLTIVILIRCLRDYLLRK
jgi:hypothetical protein